MPVIKMPSLLNKNWKILLVLLFGFLCSCASQSEQVNKNFLKQYGGEVEQINSKRDAMNPNTQPPSNISWKDPRNIFNIKSVETTRSAYIDTSKILMPKPPEDFSPNIDTLLKGQTAQLPEDMFIVSYNLHNFPDSYGRPRLSFDDITIPKHDVFGVNTTLGEKNYQLVGNKALQRDIDFEKSLRNKGDSKISLGLIQEEKQSKRKKYLEKINKNKPDKKDVIEETKENNDKKKEMKPDDKKTENKLDQKIDEKPVDAAIITPDKKAPEANTQTPKQ